MSQPPLRPQELQAPPLDGDAFIRLLRTQKATKYPDPPPLYQALYDGSLSREHLAMWVKDMYAYWDNLYYWTGGTFVKTNEESVRSEILKRIVDIEGKELARQWSGATTPAYEELWLRFAEGLEVRRQDVESFKNFSRTHFAITTLNLYSHGYQWTWLDGIASFYAGDLHGQECLSRAYEALGTHYQVPVESMEFFRVYLQDVANYIQWEEQTLAYWCCTTERQHTAAKAFRERLDIEDQVLVSVDRVRKGERVPAQVP